MSTCVWFCAVRSDFGLLSLLAFFPPERERTYLLTTLITPFSFRIDFFSKVKEDRSARMKVICGLLLFLLVVLPRNTAAQAVVTTVAGGGGSGQPTSGFAVCLWRLAAAVASP